MHTGRAVAHHVEPSHLLYGVRRLESPCDMWPEYDDRLYTPAPLPTGRPV